MHKAPFDLITPLSLFGYESISMAHLEFLFSFLAEAWRFCANIDWYLELFIIPSTLTKAPVPAEEKQPQSVMLPPPCFTVGMVFLWWCAVLFLCQTYLLELWPKSSTLVSSDHNAFSHMLLGYFKCVFAKFSRAWMFFLPPYPIAQTHEEYGRLLSHVLHSQYFPGITAALMLL